MTEDKKEISKCRVVAASVMGTSHEKRLQPCQDAHRWKLLPNGILIAAVADGAGSATLAEIGAEIAVNTAVKSIAEEGLKISENDPDDCWHQLLTASLKMAREAVETEAQVREVKSRDLASTLILAIATPELIAVAQIGDGAAAIGDSDGNIIAVTVPPCGEYINETIFLISDNALETAQLRVWRGKLAHLAIFSDGLQMLALKMPEGAAHVPFFSPLFKFVGQVEDEGEAKEQLESFLKSPRVTERTDDDLTLLLASFSV